jgi:hypothetical protein
MKNKFFYSLAISIVFALCIGLHSAEAATISMRANPVTVSPGSAVTVSVVVNSEGAAINDVSGTVQFPTSLLNVVAVTKNTATFPLWIADPSYSNTAGTVTFEGGVPNPGYTGSYGTVLTITFRAINAGTANVTFSSDTAVRANDGLGTDVLDGQQGATIAIAQPAVQAPTPPVTTTPVTASTTPSTSVNDIVITSSTDPNPALWYKGNNASFQWTLPTGTDEVRTGISKDAAALPTVTYSPAITSKTVTDLADGIWHFSVRAHVDGAWQKPSTYTVQIDATAPQDKTVSVAYNDSTNMLTINSDAQDATSGIDHYDLYINGIEVKSIPAADLAGGSYELSVTASGDNTFDLIAFDRAGNSVTAEEVFHAAAVPIAQNKIAKAWHSIASVPVNVGTFATTLPYGILFLIIVILLTICLTYLTLHRRGKLNLL